jgi:maleylpyruvate isomerase
VASLFDFTTDSELLDALQLARRGQAYYAQKVNELTSDEFDEPSRVGGWKRREVIAHVGLNARALSRLTQWAATGIRTPMYDSPGQRNDEINAAAALDPQVLRELSDEAALHLNDQWRQLDDSQWKNEVVTAQGRVVPVSETVWMRTREVWIHAVDLDNGASFDDFPPELVDRLLLDVTSSWRKRRDAEVLGDFTLEPTDRPSPVSTDPDGAAVVVCGSAAELAEWATGRGTTGLRTADGAEVPTAPRWL